jgi:hypothetical protein
MKKIIGAHFPPFESVEYTQGDEKMSQDFRDKFIKEMKEPQKPNPNYAPPASVGCETPEYRRMTPPPAPKPAQGATEYITISVAEYHFLTKTATLLEAILNAEDYSQPHVVKAVKNTVEEMKRTAEAGAEE